MTDTLLTDAEITAALESVDLNLEGDESLREYFDKTEDWSRTAERMVADAASAKTAAAMQRELDEAKDALERYKEQTRKYLRGSADRLERRVESKESLDNRIDALRQKGQTLADAVNDMRNAFDGAIGGIGVSGLEFTRRENAINKAEAALKDWDA